MKRKLPVIDRKGYHCVTTMKINSQSGFLNKRESCLKYSSLHCIPQAEKGVVTIALPQWEFMSYPPILNSLHSHFHFSSFSVSTYKPIIFVVPSIVKSKIKIKKERKPRDIPNFKLHTFHSNNCQIAQWSSSTILSILVIWRRIRHCSRLITINNIFWNQANDMLI